MVLPFTQRNGFRHLVVDVEALKIFSGGVSKAVELINLTPRSCRIDAALVGIDVKIARFLVKAPAAVKLVFKAIAQHPLALLKPTPFISGVITAIGIFRAQIRQRERI